MTATVTAMSAIVVETILLSADDGELRYRSVRQALPDGVHPDSLARDLAGFGGDRADPARLLHSTSWRFAAGSVVLTYAALPDPQPDAAVPLDLSRSLPYADDPLAPGSDQLTADDVAAHACRHLAYLRRTDPVVALTAGAAPRLWDLIAGLTPAMAGLVIQPGSGMIADRGNRDRKSAMCGARLL